VTIKRGIPFVAVFSHGGERNARLALKDPTTPPDLRAELERYLADPFAAAAADQARLLAEADARSNPGKGRKPGVKNKAASRIESQFDNLLRKNPDCSAEEIRTLKGSKSIRAMGKSTVARHWKAAKKRRLALTSD
jgi:hypothetical protein